MKKLLVVGSNSVHVYHFIDLVQSYFDEVLLISDQLIVDKKVNSEVVNFHLGWSSIKTVKQIQNIAQKFNPSHIHIHQANSYAFLTLFALKKLKVQKVLNAWGSDILLNPKKSILLREMVKFSLRNSDVIVADSNTVLKEAKKYVSNILTKNVNFGIDFMPCHKEKENIIYSNRLHKKLYNIDKILISFSKLIKVHPTWKLVIAGKGDETHNLEILAQELGISEHVDFIGFVDKEINFQYYCRSKIYVSVPKSDSISLSLVEAIVSGCIVFVSSLDANREIVDEKLGFIEDDLENIDFMKYETIDQKEQHARTLKIQEVFSKTYNRQRYIEIYEN